MLPQQGEDALAHGPAGGLRRLLGRLLRCLGQRHAVLVQPLGEGFHRSCQVPRSRRAAWPAACLAAYCGVPVAWPAASQRPSNDAKC
jgi:hypothetical protein